MDLVKIGLRIKDCRRRKNLTQEKFAELVEVSPHYIYEIERGTKAMSLYTLNGIVQCLDVSADYLLYGNDYQKSSDFINNTTDTLATVIEKLSPTKRESLAEIILVLLPHLK